MKYKFSKEILSLLFLFLLTAMSISPAAAQEAEVFCVVAPIAPVALEPGLVFKDAALQEGGFYLLEDAPGFHDVVVYGNHVSARAIAGQYATEWLELLGERGESLGYVRREFLRPVPPYSKTERRYFWTRRDAPALSLHPGGDALAGEYDFSLLKGEVVSCVGEYAPPPVSPDEGGRWLLLRFSTAESTGYPGVGARYAWGREDDFLSLETYKPDFTGVPSSDMPPRIRGGLGGEGGYAFDALQLARVARHGFWIDPAPLIPESVAVDDMADLYAGTAEFVPAFVTTDIFFHAWHLIFGRMLQKTEERFLAGALERYLTAALAELDARAQRISAAYPQAPHDAIMTARDMLTLPLALLSDPSKTDRTDQMLSPAAALEYRKILAAEGRGPSAVTGAVTDYTLYRPRSHYTLTPALSRYFRAMSFLGDATLRLNARDERVAFANASAVALLCLATESRGVRPRFDALMTPLRVMTGRADDTSVDDCAAVVKRITAGREESVTTPETARALRTALLAAGRVPRIGDKPAPRPNMAGDKREEEAGFRLIGKSFAYDAYIFANLTSPAVGTAEEPRNLPAPEDVMAVLGSEAAYALTNGYTEKYRNYGFNRRALMDETPGFLASPEADTAYSAWLRVLADSFTDSGSPQFFYRGGGMWRWKKLLTASASWAELKHDTVLYAKQSGAEMGGGGEWIPGQFEPPRPRGYVEPEPQVFSRMYEAVGKLREMLDTLKETSGYEDGEYAHKLDTFGGLCRTAREVAEKEARNLPLGASDYEDIEALARTFTADLLLPEDGQLVDRESGEQLKMALATDVASDYTDGAALHAATGTPRRIFVHVNDSSGGPRLAVGYVYSYYEFTRPLEEGRATDEEWRGLVYDPARQGDLEGLRPAWYGRLRF